MPNRVKRTIQISDESDFEIHRWAKLWGVTVTAARERCYHYTAACYDQVGAGDIPPNELAALR